MFKDLIQLLLEENVRPAKGVSLLQQENDKKTLKIRYHKTLENYQPLHCWYNCKAHVNKYGGDVIFGWALYDFKEYQLAQHHAVWLSPNKEYFDITPEKNRVNDTTIFLIDNRAPFDYATFKHPFSLYKFKKENIRIWGESFDNYSKDFCIAVKTPTPEILKFIGLDNNV